MQRRLRIAIFFIVTIGILAIMVAIVSELRYPFSHTPLVDFHFDKMNSLDRKVWGFEIGNTVAGYNEESQTYTDLPENVRIENGMLIIQAFKKELNDRHYTSARIFFKELNVRGGKLVFVAKFPSGAGAVPAIWLRTREPRADRVMTSEIDIAEGQGARPGLIFSNVHTEGSVALGNNPFQGQVSVPDMYDTFHEYGVEWTEDRIVFTLDGVPYHTVETTVKFNLYPVINLAIGGDWAVSLSKRLELGLPNGIDDSTEDQWILYIKSIQYFPLKEEMK